MEKIDLKLYWNKGISYSQYKEIITKKAEEDNNSSDEKLKELAEYTQLNLSRIERNDKTLVLEDSIINKLKSLNKKIYFLVISEGWCGDASQSVPVMNKIVENSDAIEMQVVFRDENEELINQYLTNGGKSIPILVILDEDFKEIAHWGARPVECDPFLKKYKENPQIYTHTDFARDIQEFYNNNKGKSVSKEILNLL